MEPTVPNGPKIEKSYKVLTPIDSYELLAGRVVPIEPNDPWGCEWIMTTLTPNKGGGATIFYHTDQVYALF